MRQQVLASRKRVENRLAPIKRTGNQVRNSKVWCGGARRALLFSKTGRLLPIEVLEAVLQGWFGSDDQSSLNDIWTRVELPLSARL
jgi:hypothetical protein